MFRHWSIGLSLGLVLLGCQNNESSRPGVELTDNPATGDGAVAEADAGLTVCMSDADCSDQLFCTGGERCLPAAPGADARGCLPGPAACAQGSSCLEQERTCKPCAEDDDLDNDSVAGIACGGLDCADDDPNRYPGNTEICDDGHDEDCNLDTFGERDLDNDGFFDSACANTGGARGSDCNDANASVHPLLAEVCNGIDDNCSGEADEGLLHTYYEDRDGDEQGDKLPDGGIPEGTQSCANDPQIAESARDCDPLDPTRNELQLEFCDGKDNDCDQAVDEARNNVVWYRDEDGDGFGDAKKPTMSSCYPPGDGWSILKRDCDDSDPEVNPTAAEICDGKDNNCNGRADYFVPGGGYEDDDSDGKADSRCARSEPDCDDLDYTTYAGAPELCDGRDNDCDGKADVGTQEVRWYVDVDRDGFGDELAFIESCKVQPGRVQRGGDCDDSNPRVNPGSQDDCGGKPGADDDCDGESDEGEQRATWFLDEDHDEAGAGDPVLACLVPNGRVAQAGDCAAANPAVHPGVAEVCDDDLDNDCDSARDCDDSECYTHSKCQVEAELTLEKGGAQSAPVGKELTTSIQVRLHEPGHRDRPLTARFVTLFSESGTGPSKDHERTKTDANGIATFVVRAGRHVGTDVLRMSAEHARPLTVSVEVTEPAAGQVLTLVNALKLVGDGDGVTGESVIATWARPVSLSGVVAAADGSLYLSSENDRKIYRLTADGRLEHFAGGGPSFVDGVSADATSMTPSGLALDESDPENPQLYLADLGSARVRVIALRTRIINTVAGGGTAPGPDYGDGQAATSAQLQQPTQLALIGRALYVTDQAIAQLRKIDLDEGVIDALQPVAPPGLTLCPCTFGCAIAAGPHGELFFAARAVGSDVQDAGGQCDGVRGTAIVRVDRAGTLHHVAGRRLGAGGDGISALAAQLPNPLSMAFDEAGNLYVGGDTRVRRIDATTSVVRTVLGDGTSGITGDYAPDGRARIRSARGLAFHDDHLLVADYAGASLRSVWKLGTREPTQLSTVLDSNSVMSGQILKAAGKLTVRVLDAQGAALAQVPVRIESLSKGARVETPIALSLADGRAGSVVWPGRAVKTYDLQAYVETLHGEQASEPLDVRLAGTAPAAGTVLPLVNVNREQPLFGADGRVINGVPGPAVSARIGTPDALALAGDGTLYVASTSLSAIYTVSPEGEISLLAGAGTGATGSSGDGGLARDALMNTPTALALDPLRHLLYVGESGNASIRVVTLEGAPTIDYVVGLNDRTTGLAVSPEGDVYVSQDSGNSNGAVLRVPAGTHSLESVLLADPTTFPGETHLAACSPNCTFAFDGTALLLAGTMNGPPFEGSSNLSGTALARWVPGPSSVLERLAGGPSSDDPNTSPFLFNVRSIASLAGDVYFSEPDMGRVRRADPDYSPIIAGGGNETGDYGQAEALRLSSPEAIAITGEGHLIIADTNASKVRLVWSKIPLPPPP